MNYYDLTNEDILLKLKSVLTFSNVLSREEC